MAASTVAGPLHRRRYRGYPRLALVFLGHVALGGCGDVCGGPPPEGPPRYTRVKPTLISSDRAHRRRGGLAPHLDLFRGPRFPRSALCPHCPHRHLRGVHGALLRRVARHRAPHPALSLPQTAPSFSRSWRSLPKALRCSPCPYSSASTSSTAAATAHRLGPHDHAAHAHDDGLLHDRWAPHGRPPATGKRYVAGGLAAMVVGLRHVFGPSRHRQTSFTSA